MSVSPDPDLPTWAVKPADYSSPPTPDSEDVKEMDDEAFSQNNKYQKREKKKSLGVITSEQSCFRS